MSSVAALFVLDVGHGSCNVIIGNESVAVVDTGRSRTLLEFLEQRDVDNVDLVLVSHADEDHLGGLVGILSSGIRVGRVVLNADALKDTELWADMTVILDRMSEHSDLEFGVGLHRGQTYGFDDFSLVVDAPRAVFAARGVGSRLGDTVTTSNSLSAVVSVTVGGARWALLTGDIDWVGLTDLLEVVPRDGGLRTELLIFPHHGGRSGGHDEAFADAVLDMTRPSTVGFSIGRTHQTPRVPHVWRAIDRGCRVMCTQLSTRCAADLPEDEPAHHLLDVVGRGRLAGACCAGSISLTLDGTSSALPVAEQHAEFIDRAVATPLCRGPA